MTTIALLSAGAMGSALGGRLSTHGARVLTSLAGRGTATIARAEAAGMIDVSDEALAGAEIILAVTPPAEAEPLARRLLPLISQATRKPLYLDANALSPASKQALATLLTAAGARFVDGAIIGGPPVAGKPGPALYVAGPAAGEAELLARHGLDVRTLDGPVGAAAALKMCYGGINKGLVGLGAAMLLAAERAGAGRALRDEMALTMPDLAARFGRQVPDMYPKAYRWVAEMREVAAFLGDDADGAAIYAGMARLFDHLAHDIAGEGADRATLDRALARAAG